VSDTGCVWGGGRLLVEQKMKDGNKCKGKKTGG
jgi:hypothetical protein